MRFKNKKFTFTIGIMDYELWIMNVSRTAWATLNSKVFHS